MHWIHDPSDEQLSAWIGAWVYDTGAELKDIESRAGLDSPGSILWHETWPDLDENEDDEKCSHCGHSPATGACFYCKMD